MTLEEFRTAYEEQIIKDRRFLHENPEVSLKEVHTSAFIIREAEKLRLSY